MATNGKRNGRHHPPSPLPEPPPPVVERISVYTHPALNNHEIRRVAVQGMCDPRCVVKYLRGMPQPETMRERVRRALNETGHASLVGYPTTSAVNRAELAATRDSPPEPTSR
jgi:hypothetical protein